MPHSVDLVSETEGCKQATFTKIEMKNVFLAKFGAVPVHFGLFSEKNKIFRTFGAVPDL